MIFISWCRRTTSSYESPSDAACVAVEKVAELAGERAMAGPREAQSHDHHTGRASEGLLASVGMALRRRISI